MRSQLVVFAGALVLAASCNSAAEEAGNRIPPTPLELTVQEDGTTVTVGLRGEGNQFPPVIQRNQRVSLTWDETATAEWVSSVRLFEFRAYELPNEEDARSNVFEPSDELVLVLETNQGDVRRDEGDVILRPGDTVRFRLETEYDQPKHRLIKCSIAVNLTSGKTVEVDPIIDERPGN